MNIGIIDSGMGGRCLLDSLSKSYKSYHFILVMDHSLFPYGNKSKEVLYNRIKNFIDVLISRNVTMVILACNTISAMILEELKKNYSIPILGIIEPTIQALLDHEFKHVCLIATKNTIDSNVYQNLFKKYQISYHCIAHPDLIALIENKASEEKIIEEIKKIDINRDCEAILLGCTHFIKIKDVFKALFPQKIISQDEIFELNKGSITILSL